jgi:hypothetical protein
VLSKGNSTFQTRAYVHFLFFVRRGGGGGGWEETRRERQEEAQVRCTRTPPADSRCYQYALPPAARQRGAAINGAVSTGARPRCTQLIHTCHAEAQWHSAHGRTSCNSMYLSKYGDSAPTWTAGPTHAALLYTQPTPEQPAQPGLGGPCCFGFFVIALELRCAIERRGTG